MPWRLAIGVLSVVALCAIGGFRTFFLLDDGGRGHRAAAPAARDISSRDADPNPLTVAEVFPGPTLTLTGPAPGYPILASESSTDCAGAVIGRLAAVVARAGCDQVVRATVRSPDGSYLVTLGVLNLADTVAAHRVYQQAKVLVDTGRGTFGGLSAGPGTEVLAGPAARVGWHVRGHFVVYGVVARADGGRISDREPRTRQILSDLVPGYLRESVLGRRAAGRS
ncbi:MAG TPA: hypothetical protein VES42_29425 [Pilimelia sp.]|nr:hypothetical protein [Pilimelia sp.]